MHEKELDELYAALRQGEKEMKALVREIRDKVAEIRRSVKSEKRQSELDDLLSVLPTQNGEINEFSFDVCLLIIEDIQNQERLKWLKIKPLGPEKPKKTFLRLLR